MREQKRGIYIHMPFCVQKCRYCAFLSFTDTSGLLRGRYMQALRREIMLRSEALSEKAGRETTGNPDAIDTVYIGGGTPSVMDISQMSEMTELLHSCFKIKPGAEFTLEANPATLGIRDSVMLSKLQAYRSMGINRLSMGVQSMDNGRLRYLGRIHTAENVTRDMEMIRRKGFDNVNLDLIFSIPNGSSGRAGEAMEVSMDDLARVLEFRPEHISCYSLQIEEGTPFYGMAERGELTEVSDEEDRRTYHRICDVLREAGYEHYEISNFARTDDGGCGVSPYRSRHNSLYWNMDEYIGLGLGASGFVNGVRYKNTSDLDEYTAMLADGKLPAAEKHINTPFDNISEAVFTGLRRREGITYEDAAAAYMRARGGDEDASVQGGSRTELFWDIFADAKKEAEDYAARGLLIMNDEGLRLTEQGIDISNSIMSLFV